MDKVSDRYGFIVVYPAGTGKLFNDRLLVWNDGRTDKHGKPYTADDVGFVTALLDDLVTFFNVDPRRVYACGFSNGAQFSYTLANRLSDRIAAIAAVAGHRTVDQYFPPPPRPISVMQFSGLEDKLAPYDGGIPPATVGPVAIDFKFTMKPVKEAIQSWPAHNGCPPEPSVTQRVGKAVMERYGPCQDDTEAVLWTLEDGGHTWPGGTMFPSEVKAGLGNANRDISASGLMWEFFEKHPMPASVDIPVVSYRNDDRVAQRNDTSKDRIQGLYDYYENQCLEKEWQKAIINVNGLPRKILWKGPKESWKNGAIIALHGGGGTYSNFCANIRIGKPMIEFSDLAISEGFAIFSLDSEEGFLRDANGCSCGKRWLSMAEDNKSNPDLFFIEKVITEIIPGLRQANSAKDIFITGISNGGFMTVLAAAYFDDKISAFAPVSAGDPYGIYVDCAEGSAFRHTPGKLIDSETNKPINENDACKADSYPHEKKWKIANSEKKPFFKLFYHEGDGVDNTSCKKKVKRLLVEHGYKDDGSFVIKDDSGKTRVSNHFWQKEYNQPLIEFFTKSANRDRQ